MFADVDPVSQNITAATIEAVLTERTKAIVPVHLAGWPCDMPAIMALAERRGIRVVEDCAQAQGASVGGRPVGSFGDAAAFSFCQDKIITTGGEGGYLSFRDEAAWEWAWSFKDHGKSWAKVNMPAAGPGFRWLHDSVGTNWRLTGPQAAIGIAQLRKLPRWTEARGRNAAIWAEALAGVPALRVPVPGEGFRHAWYKFYAYVPDGAKAERDRILARANAEGIRLFSGSCSEVYLEAAFDDLPRPGLPIARRLGETSLMMEVHPTLRPDLTRRRAERVAEIAREVLG